MALRPNHVEDRIFGRLEWDEELEWYSATIELNPSVWVEVTLEPDKDVELEEFLNRTHDQYLRLKPRLPEIYSHVRTEFLELYNSDWSKLVNGYGQPVGHGIITSDQFDSLMFFESIWFVANGSIELRFYDNNELFLGHSIRVTVEDDMRIKSTGLEG